jgi:E2F-associated phosphoprotein
VKRLQPNAFTTQALRAQDEAWAAKLRAGRKSDAVLSCPACLTTVCLDCQQHAEEEGQFRAMFVMNCRWDIQFV